MPEASPNILRFPHETKALREYLNSNIQDLEIDPVDTLRRASESVAGNSLDLLASLLNPVTLEMTRQHIKNFPVKVLSPNENGEIRYASHKGDIERAIVVPPQNIVNVFNKLREVQFPLGADSTLASSARLVSGYAEGLAIFDAISPSHVFEEGERGSDIEGVRHKLAVMLLATGFRGEIRTVDDLTEHINTLLPHSYAATILYAHLREEFIAAVGDHDIAQLYVDKFVENQISRVAEASQLGVVVSSMDKGMAHPLPTEDFTLFTRFASTLYEHGHSVRLIKD